MPRDGEAIKAYCPYCGHETTHVYHTGWYQGTYGYWKRLGCGVKK